MKAFIFDLNGTIIDDMEFHCTAWHDILNNNLHADMDREAVRKEMYGKNEELLERVFGKGHFSDEEMSSWSQEKEKAYQAAYRPHMRLLPGLAEFFEGAHTAGIPMGIGSAAIPFNIDFILDNLGIRKYFRAIVSAADVTVSKPHPETFLKCALQLGADAKDCIVFEDAPKGVEAAANAGMSAVVLTTCHRPESFGVYDNVLFHAADYTDPRVKDLLKIK